ncbi:MAG TPA: AI-2E family transporter, partial [Leptolyngbyaceae cyanobacterium]
MRLGQWVSLLALGIAIYILWQIRQVLLLLFAAAVLATVLNRVVRFLRRSRIGRGPAIALTMLMLFVVLFSLFAIILPRLGGQLQLIANALPQVVDRLEFIYDNWQTRIPGNLLADNQGLDNLLQELQALGTRLIGNLFGFVSSSVGILLNFLLFLAATIMLLVTPMQYRRIFTLA